MQKRIIHNFIRIDCNFDKQNNIFIYLLTSVSGCDWLLFRCAKMNQQFRNALSLFLRFFLSASLRSRIFPVFFAPGRHHHSEALGCTVGAHFCHADIRYDCRSYPILIIWTRSLFLRFFSFRLCVRSLRSRAGLSRSLRSGSPGLK
jgi:hypothetical protein